MNTKDPWVPFYFDGNLAWGMVESREVWDNHIVDGNKRHKTEAELLDAPENVHSGRTYPRFGWHLVKKGKRTLADHFRENAMTPSYILRGEPPDAGFEDCAP